MSDLNPQELVVASSGHVHVAPVGTVLPAIGTAPTVALAAGFGYGLGYVTEDGVTLNSKPDVKDFGAWQSLDPVRRERTGRENMVSFALEQWNEQTFPLAFGGGTVTEYAPGIYTFVPPSGTDALAEISMVIDATDGGKHYRWVFPRGNVTEATETQLQRGELATLSVGFKALAPASGGSVWYLLTDDPAFELGS